MKITYAICVCDEHNELDRLLMFLKKTKHPDDDINLLIDTKNVTVPVRNVVEKHIDSLQVCERPFDMNFGKHRNFQFKQCTGDYIFIIDADELPREPLIKNIRGIIKDSESDCLAIPRINIIPDLTDEQNEEWKFNVNEHGWINWPDYTYRIFKNNSKIKYVKQELHEVLSGADAQKSLVAHPSLAIWHIKYSTRQMKQHLLYKQINEQK